MKKIWEFFENLNEVVYVADVDTHELIYMNKKTLEIYNLHSLDELKGKKCHELLQKSLAPVLFAIMMTLKKDVFGNGSITIRL